ncbi:MAG: ThuA domain-containing protein [Firmicutes bacterium]|nr:ThuA domain-containing protein [Bacillota bacterium]
MSREPRGILFGDYNSEIHPVNGIDQEIINIFQGDIDITCIEGYDRLTRSDLAGLELVICYADRWQEKTSSKLVDAILSYVSGGGALLAIHNGIQMAVDFELAQMLGGKFVGHPPYQDLEYTFANPKHPIIQGMEPWTMGEEPYQFTFTQLHEKDIFLEYVFEGKKWPAGWTIDYGLGKIVYLAPGHDLSSFKHPSFRELLLRSSHWARGL